MKTESFSHYKFRHNGKIIYHQSINDSLSESEHFERLSKQLHKLANQKSIPREEILWEEYK